jgi:hypothetical protein
VIEACFKRGYRNFGGVDGGNLLMERNERYNTRVSNEGSFPSIISERRGSLRDFRLSGNESSADIGIRRGGDYTGGLDHKFIRVAITPWLIIVWTPQNMRQK